jgi:uncharacterized membrane protein YfcA
MTTTALIVLGAVALGGLAQSVAGLGLVLVCGPILVAVCGPSDGVRLAVTLSLALNVLVLIRWWHQADWRWALLVLMPAAVFTPLLAFLIRNLDTGVASLTAGSVILLGTVLVAVGKRWQLRPGPLTAILAGVASAGGNVAAGLSGPPVMLYALSTDWTPQRLVATLQAYFLLLNCVTLAVLGPPRVERSVDAAAFAGLALGLAVGWPLLPRVPSRLIRWLALGISAAGCLAVILRFSL